MIFFFSYCAYKRGRVAYKPEGIAAMRYVLLDRDGTIIVNKHYQKDPEETELLPGAKAGLDALKANGFGLVLVSNQSGIGRGLLTHADAQAINSRMARDLGDEENYFKAMYYCPHRPEEGCDCRKPLPGMALRAAREHGVVLGDAYAIGDSEADIRLGKAVGAATILVRTGGGGKTEAAGTVRPDHIADDLKDAAAWILQQKPLP